MNTRNQGKSRISPLNESFDPGRATSPKMATDLNEELQLDETDRYGGDPYNSAPAAPLEQKRNLKSS